MPGVAGKINIDTRDAVENIRKFNRELERPIGIVEQIETNIQDLKRSIYESTDPAQVKKLTEELKKNEMALANYTGRGLRALRQEHGQVNFALQSTTHALMGFMFILSSFSTDDANESTSKFRKHLSEATQTTLGFSFAISALGGTLSKFALPIGIAAGALVTLIGFLGDANAKAKELAEQGLEKLAAELKSMGSEEALLLLYAQLKGKKETRVYKEGAIHEKFLELTPEEKATFEWLDKWYKEWIVGEKAKQKAHELWLSQANDVQKLAYEIRQLKDLQEKGLIFTPEGLNIADELYLKTKKLRELQKSSLEEQDKLNKENEEAIIAWLKKREKEREEFEEAHEKAYYEWFSDQLRLEREAAEEYDKIIEKERKDRIKLLNEQYDAMQDLNQSAVNFGDTLTIAFEKAGQTGLARFSNILSLAIKILSIVQAINFGEKKEGAGILDIFSLIIGSIGFERGGYTGNLPRNRIAGVVHGGEIVFEKPIVDIYKNELLALRASLQQSRPIAGYASGGFVGGSVGTIYVTGKVDLDNGKIFLRKTMPSYEKFRKHKVR